MPVAKVPNHAHCVECGKAIPPSEDTCSQECTQALEEDNKRRKRMTYFMYGLMALVIVMMIAPVLLGSL